MSLFRLVLKSRSFPLRHFGSHRFPPMRAVGTSLSSEVTNIPNVPYLLYFFFPRLLICQYLHFYMLLYFLLFIHQIVFQSRALKVWQNEIALLLFPFHPRKLMITLVVVVTLMAVLFCPTRVRAFQYPDTLCIKGFFFFNKYVFWPIEWLRLLFIFVLFVLFLTCLTLLFMSAAIRLQVRCSSSSYRKWSGEG